MHAAMTMLVGRLLYVSGADEQHKRSTSDLCLGVLGEVLGTDGFHVGVDVLFPVIFGRFPHHFHVNGLLWSHQALHTHSISIAGGRTFMPDILEQRDVRILHHAHAD